MLAVAQRFPAVPPTAPHRRLAPDAASVVGLLHLRKLPALGTLAPPAPEVALHLVRHRRRRLAISPVEIDPGARRGWVARQPEPGASISRSPRVLAPLCSCGKHAVGTHRCPALPNMCADAEAADAEAASSAGKSVAAVLCGGPPKAASPIDF